MELSVVGDIENAQQTVKNKDRNGMYSFEDFSLVYCEDNC